MKAILCAIFLFSTLFIGLTAVSAQTSDLSQKDMREAIVHVYEEDFQKKMSDIPLWQSAANFLLFLAMFTAIFGAFIAALQGFKGKYFKITAAVLGILIAVLTAVSNLAFENDYRAYIKSIKKIENLKPGIQNCFIELKMSLSDEAMFNDKLNNFKIIFEELKKLTEGLEPIPVFSGLSCSRAAAQPAGPDWLQGTPEEENALFFVSEGKGGSISEAKKNAVIIAQKKAENYIITMLKSEYNILKNSCKNIPADLSDHLLRSFAKNIISTGSIARSFSEAKTAGEYKYSVLFKFDREILDMSIKSMLEKQIKKINGCN